MKVSGGFSLSLAAIVCLFVMGCSQPKPEGPAERIGKGIDEIAGAVKDYDRDRPQLSSREQRYRVQQERTYGIDCSGSEYYRNPRCREEASVDDDSYGRYDDSYRAEAARQDDTRRNYDNSDFDSSPRDSRRY